MSQASYRFRWLLFIAAALKAAYLAEYLTLPFVDGPLFDAQVYLLQARRVREGRFGDATLLAFSPLYGYVLALLKARAGSILPLMVQLGLGLANLALLRRVGENLFGRGAGVWAAFWYLAYGPLTFFESKIMSETLGLTLCLVALDLFVQPGFREAHARPCLLAGTALGGAVLARASLLFAAPFFVLAALAPLPSGAQDANPELISVKRRARRAGALGLALGLVLLANGTWTYVHSGLFVPVILVSNTAAQSTTLRWTGDLSVFRATPAAAVSAFSVVEQAEVRLRRARAGEHDDTGERRSLGVTELLGWLRNAPQKAWHTLRDTETSFDYGFYGERTEVVTLRWLGASFGMLLGFAGVGVVLAIHRGHGRALWALLPVVAGVFAVTTLFHPSTRYRLPLVLVLCPLAGYAWACAVELAVASKRLGILIALGVLSLGLGLRHALHGLENPGMWELRVAEAAAVAGDRETAEARVAQALSLQPHSLPVQERARYVRSIISAVR